MIAMDKSESSTKPRQLALLAQTPKTTHHTRGNAGWSDAGAQRGAELPSSKTPSVPETGPAASHPPYLDQKALALRWGIHARTLQRWRQMGTGPRYLQIGRRVRYRLDDILAYEEQMRRGRDAGE